MQNQIENVMTIINYIEDHLTENPDLDTIAEAMHYSKYHMHRVFAEETGLTIHNYMQRRRLTEAAKLLVFSEKPIMEIALIAGYESQQAFTAVFKEMYKKTPGKYREEEEFYPLQPSICPASQSGKIRRSGVLAAAICFLLQHYNRNMNRV